MYKRQGLVNAQVAKAYGARVIITEISPKKLERAKAMNIGEVINSKECDPVQAVKDLTGGKEMCIRDSPPTIRTNSAKGL